MKVYSFDPLNDERWPQFLAAQPHASVFHTRQWLEAIRRTYDYRPIGFTTSGGEKLDNALLFCEIRSWLTGRRLVSLPFSDHCQPLAEGDDLEAILHYLQTHRSPLHCKYIELRPLQENEISKTTSGFGESGSFSFQRIDLQPELAAIYRGFHDSCIRRKIKRAEKENLFYESGRSEDLLRKFRHLLLITRRRHKLPPQPAAWFQNIADCLGNIVTIHMVSKDAKPVASIVTLTYRKTLIYKYGCSDGQFNNMGGTPYLFWMAIQQAKESGIEHFDLGRSDYDDPGLIAFKEHLGATSSELRYYRNPGFPARQESSAPSVPIKAWAREALIRLPDPLLSGVGQLVYRHIG
jgi:hypothetical protein